MGETAVVFAAMVGVLLLLARGPLPRRVYYRGKWITVRPGTTREEMEETVTPEDGTDAPEEGGPDG